MKFSEWKRISISIMLVIVMLAGGWATALISINKPVSATSPPPSPRRAIMLTGYWNPTGQMIEEFSQNLTLNPGGWKGENWEGLDYDIYSFFPYRRDANDVISQGDFEIDYQNVSIDFWRITNQLHPIAIISLGFGSEEGFEIEYNARNLDQDWVHDYREPFLPTPCPPDTTPNIPVGYIRHSSLPVQAIADAVTDQTNGIVHGMVDWHRFPMKSLCEYMAYHDSWYQAQHNDPADPYRCLAAGFIHVAGEGEDTLPLPSMITAVETTLRTTIQYLNEARDAASMEQHVTWSGTVFKPENVTVPEGKILEIQPGSTIVFAQGRHLAVKGTLWANGTQTQQITFTSQGVPYGWQGIQFLNWSAQGRLVNCTIANATWNPTSTGITLSGCRDHSIEVIHCLITGNNYGIRLFDASSPISITQCNITNNGDGVFLSSCITGEGNEPMHPVLNNNSFLGNQRYAIEVGYSATGTSVNAQFNYFGTIDSVQINNLIYPQTHDIDLSNLLDSRASNAQVLNGAQTWNNNRILTTGVIVNGDLTITGITITCNAPIGWNFIQVNGNLILQNAHIRSFNGDATLLCTAKPNAPQLLNIISQSIINMHVRLGIQNRTMLITDTQIQSSRSGICLMNSTCGSLTSCTISDNYGSGLTFIRSTHYSVTACTLSINNGEGCAIIQSSYITLQNCIIMNNLRDGIMIRMLWPHHFPLSCVSNRIINCSITNNQENGILLFSLKTHLLKTLITNCSIKQNQGNGIFTCQGYSATQTRTIISNSSILQNKGNGVWLFQSISDTVKNCSIFNNHCNGITLTSAARYNIFGNNITDCRIFNNQEHGIFFENLGWNLYNNNISNCTIIANQMDGVHMEFFVHRLVGQRPTVTSSAFFARYPGIPTSIPQPSLSPGVVASNLEFQEVAFNDVFLDSVDSLVQTDKNFLTQKPGGVGVIPGKDQYLKNDLLCSIHLCSLNTIFGNSIADNDNGICLTNISNNTVRHNTLQENWRNIQLIDSIHNNISANNMLNLSILTNMRKSYDNGDNRWNTTYQNGGGNYWDDFDQPSEGAYDSSRGPAQDVPVIGGDGIVDLQNGGLNPYLVLGGNGRDWYPLINPYGGDPVAVPDFYMILTGTTLSVSAPGVLGNDHDRDHHNLLTAHLARTVMHGTLTLNTNGGFTYTPAIDFHGVDWFTYTDTDTIGTSRQVTVLISVITGNTAPVANDDTATVLEDSVSNRINVLANDIDVDGDALRVSAVTTPTHGTVSMGRTYVLYTPNPNFNGMDSFTYTIRDYYGATDTATVTVTVTPVNDAPIANPDVYITTEDTMLPVAAPGVLENDHDVDGDTLHAILVTGVSHGALTLNDGGSFTYTPSFNYYGPDSFTYKATDGSLDSNVVTVSITVNAPPVVQDDFYTMDEDTILRVLAPGVLANDNDIDHGPNIQLLALPGSLPHHGTLDLRVDGGFTYIPELNYFGTDQFIYKAFDGHDSSPPATVTITVNPVNDPPIAHDDTYTVPENSPWTTLDVRANDEDPDHLPLGLTILFASDPPHGRVTFDSFLVHYQPDPDYFGPDQFTYTITNHGPPYTSTATVSITVTWINDPPIAFDNPHVWTPPHTLVAIHLTAMDPDNLPQPLQYEIVSWTTHGALNTQHINEPDHVVYYLPESGWIGGSDSFTFRVSDGDAFSNIARVSLVVSEQDHE